MRNLAWVCLISAGMLPGADLPTKAHAYLDAASGLVAATPPEFQPGALLQLGSVVASYDTKRALVLYEQALAAGAALPTQKDYRAKEEFQAQIAAQVAKIDLDRALEILQMMVPPPAGEPDPRLSPIAEIVRQLIAKKKLDRAVEVVEQMGVGGAFPYNAVSLVLKALPADDNRRQNLYSQTLTGFQQRPEVEPFTVFLRTFRNSMPAQTYDTAARGLAKSLMNGNGLPEPYSQTITTDKGKVTLTDPKDIAIFNAFDLIVEVDSAWAKRYLDERPELKQAIDTYPQGLHSLDLGADGVTTRGSVKPGQSKSEIEQRANILAFETARAQEEMRHLQKDPEKSLEAIRQIPSPQLRARMLATVASVAGSKEPPEGRALLGKVIAALEDMKAPEWRSSAWSTVAGSAAKLKDMELALKALEKGLADAKVMYKIDADVDDRNLAPRSTWPSTMQYKQLFYRAAMSLGEEAELLLDKIPDTEIQVMARTEMAAAWLNAPASPWFVQVRRAPKR